MEMSDDLVQRLRDESVTWRPSPLTELCAKGADRIEELEAAKTQLCRAAAEQGAEYSLRMEALEAALRDVTENCWHECPDCSDIARRAREGKP